MNATPKMSWTSAVFFLAEMARDAAGETQVTALRVACKSLLKRHFDKMGNHVRRRTRKAVCQGSAKTEESCQTLAKAEGGAA